MPGQRRRQSSGGRRAYVISWEQRTSRLFDGIGLRSIKSKITVFALLATLIPSVTMGWLSYHNNRRAIDTSFFDSPVRNTIPKVIEGPSASVRIEIYLRDKVPFEKVQNDNVLSIFFKRI